VSSFRTSQPEVWCRGLVQVLLAHKGGLTGSMPAMHAADVVRGMTDGLTQIAGIIRDANR